MNDELRNQVAIVTGAGRGLGRAIARALAQAGAAVGVMARSEAQVAETVGAIRQAGGVALAASEHSGTSHARPDQSRRPISPGR